MGAVEGRKHRKYGRKKIYYIFKTWNKLKETWKFVVQFYVLLFASKIFHNENFKSDFFLVISILSSISVFLFYIVPLAFKYMPILAISKKWAPNSCPRCSAPFCLQKSWSQVNTSQMDSSDDLFLPHLNIFHILNIKIPKLTSYFTHEYKYTHRLSDITFTYPSVSKWYNIICCSVLVKKAKKVTLLCSFFTYTVISNEYFFLPQQITFWSQSWLSKTTLFLVPNRKRSTSRLYIVTLLI